MKRLKTLLHHKHLLLDTGIFIELQKNKQSYELREFFIEIEQAPCALLTVNQVYCEFLMHAKNKQEYLELLAFLEGIAPALLPKEEDLYRAAQLYVALKNSSPDIARKTSETDRILGAISARYQSDLFIATTNHRDFPTSLYDRDYIFGFESCEGNIQNICICKFNAEKFQKLFQ